MIYSLKVVSPNLYSDGRKRASWSNRLFIETHLTQSQTRCQATMAVPMNGVFHSWVRAALRY